MKPLKVLLIMMCVWGLCSFNAKAQRTIRNISVVFNTTNDDKDNDTYLECQLLTPDNHWIAQNAGQFGRFPDNSAYTLNLNLGSAYYAESVLSQTSLFVHIIPNGNDTWNFGWTVIVTFTDGSQRTATGTGGLNESANSFKLLIFN